MAQASGQDELAKRYAAALFELADEKSQLDAVASDLSVLSGAIGESEDLRRLMNSPVLGRDVQARAIGAVLDKAGANDLVKKFIGLAAQHRRLHSVPNIIKSFEKLLADRRGENAAEVTAAQPLTQAQQEAVSEAIRRATGGKVAIDMKVDPSLLGGLVVRIGSRMIDSSLKTKLQKLQFAMKGVG